MNLKVDWSGNNCMCDDICKGENDSKAHEEHFLTIEYREWVILLNGEVGPQREKQDALGICVGYGQWTFDIL